LAEQVLNLIVNKNLSAKPFGQKFSKLSVQHVLVQDGRRTLIRDR